MAVQNEFLNTNPCLPVINGKVAKFVEFNVIHPQNYILDKNIVSLIRSSGKSAMFIISS